MKVNNANLREVVILLLIVVLMGLQTPWSVASTQNKVLTIYFNNKSALINLSDYKKLVEVVDQINKVNGKKVVVSVTGFTRIKGNTELDKKYLIRRVNNVIEKLEDIGLNAKFTKNLNGKVNSSGSKSRKVVVTFKWQADLTPSIPVAPLVSPTNLSVTPSDRTLLVSFTPPILITGQAAITGYEYQLNSDGIWRATSSIAPFISIGGLINNTTYSIEVRAVNLIGKGIASAAISGTPINTVPNPPTNLSVVAGYGQLTINFRPGFNGGSPILDYEYTLNGGATWVPSVPRLNTSQIVIQNLTGGVNYSQIKLRAVNSNGKSTESGVISGTPLASVPSAPTNLVVSAGDGQLIINFTPAISNGSPILRYEYSLDGGSSFTQFSVNYVNSPVIITGLTNRALYTSIKLRAINSLGIGPSSATISGTPSRAPTSPTITAVVPGDRSLIVSFTPGIDYGLGVSNYQYTLDGGSTWITLTPPDGLSPITIMGLTNGVTYSALRLRAVNSVGAGDRSELFSGTPTKPATAPAAPIVISLLPGNQKVVLALSNTVSNGGSALIRYEYSLNGGNTWVPLSLPTSGNSVEITGLINGNSYTQVKLRSINGLGASPATTIPTFKPNT